MAQCDRWRKGPQGVGVGGVRQSGLSPMTHRIAILLLTLCLLPQSVWAQAKNRGCFTKAEMTAETIVREGLRLREGALGCDGPPWNMGTRPLWEEVDRVFGPRFAQQTHSRMRAFQREFQDDAVNRLQMWDARTVMHYRHYPVSQLYCEDIRDTLQDVRKSGWSIIPRQAAKGRDAVEMDYRPCK